MFLTNLKIAYRNLIRNKGFSFINISGLAIGMACTILLLLWVNHELSYDKFHKNEKQLFQIVNWQTYSGQEYAWPNLPGQLVELVKEKTPEIIRASNTNPWGERSLFVINGTKNYESVYHADPDFFQMFSFPLVKGNAEKVFEDPYSLVITEKIAEKYFGESDPIGQVVKYDNKHDLTITGVLKDLPTNSVFKFGLIYPYEFKKKIYSSWNKWGSHTYSGYVELDPNADPEQVSAKLNSFYVDHVDKESTERVSLFPLSKTHLHSLDGEETRMKMVRLFLIIALFILLIACFNFMNLSTARASKRAKEIGLKKAIGSSKRQLVFQFLMESLLFAFIAINFAIILVRLFLPEFNHIIGQNLQWYYDDWSVIGIMFSVVVITGLLAGSYPAFYLTSYKTIDVIKGATTSGKRGAAMRRLLVVLQFTLTTILLIGTLVISLQTKFMKTRPTGIDKSDVAFVVLNGEMNKNRESIKEELAKDPSILSSCFMSNLPISIYSNGGGFEWNGEESTKDVLITHFYADADFMDVYKASLLEGRFYNQEHFAADSNNIVINEALAKMIDEGSVLGKTISQSHHSAEVIGVVKDFNYTHLESSIKPMMFFPFTNRYNFLSIKIEGNSKSRAIAHIEQICEKYNPDFPTTIGFIEDKYEALYKTEDSIIAILNYFTLLTIIISCLGLFGLASFMAEEKTKEIGVRKVLGASVFGLISLLSKNFTKSVAIANLIAWPIAWFFMDMYLSEHAYRIDMPWWIFISVAVMVLIVALATVSYQSWKSASQNPIESLKYE